MNDTIKPIETIYNGYKFRSRLEARWAVFFDACKVDYEYESEGYQLSDGTYYLPDFVLHGLTGRCSPDLYVEVKGQMTDKDFHKIYLFSNFGERPLIVLGQIPKESPDAVERIGHNFFNLYECCDASSDFFNFCYIDGDQYPCLLGVSKNKTLECYGCDWCWNCNNPVDEEKTLKAYDIARQARFEHGETPKNLEDIWK